MEVKHRLLFKFTSNSMPSISDFAALDDLIQIIYQGFNKFIIISKVLTSSWIINVALAGEDGRWWKGVWSDSDLATFAGNDASQTLVEAHADKLADALRKGELHITDWSPKPGAPIMVSSLFVHID